MLTLSSAGDVVVFKTLIIIGTLLATTVRLLTAASAAESEPRPQRESARGASRESGRIGIAPHTAKDAVRSDPDIEHAMHEHGHMVHSESPPVANAPLLLSADDQVVASLIDLCGDPIGTCIKRVASIIRAMGQVGRAEPELGKELLFRFRSLRTLSARELLTITAASAEDDADTTTLRVLSNLESLTALQHEPLVRVLKFLAADRLAREHSLVIHGDTNTYEYVSNATGESVSGDGASLLAFRVAYGDGPTRRLATMSVANEKLHTFKAQCPKTIAAKDADDAACVRTWLGITAL
jgi:hypothetical protein